jgi:1-acyl-sn-glycerol-3-phosphate acyltransferase
MGWLAAKLMRARGWRFVGARPTMRKFVVIAAPHTSNWDFVIFLAVAHHFRIRARVLGKHTLVRWPFGSLMRKLGVIPVRRDAGHGLVDQIAAVFTASDELALTITPEGTRSAVTHWRSGFYRIALAAGVPIILAFIDGDEKTAGLGPTLDPSGDLDRDMSTIRDFYGSIRGIKPERQGPIRLLPATDADSDI